MEDASDRHVHVVVKPYGGPMDGAQFTAPTVYGGHFTAAIVGASLVKSPTRCLMRFEPPWPAWPGQQLDQPIDIELDHDFFSIEERATPVKSCVLFHVRVYPSAFVNPNWPKP